MRPYARLELVDCLPGLPSSGHPDSIADIFPQEKAFCNWAANLERGTDYEIGLLFS
jgi:hypothetical protein